MAAETTQTTNKDKAELPAATVSTLYINIDEVTSRISQAISFESTVNF